jgi:hypothetical protein
VPVDRPGSGWDFRPAHCEGSWVAPIFRAAQAVRRISYSRLPVKPVSPTHIRAPQGDVSYAFPIFVAACPTGAAPQRGKKVTADACSQFGIMQM